MKHHREEEKRKRPSKKRQPLLFLIELLTPILVPTPEQILELRRQKVLSLLWIFNTPRLQPGVSANS
jgi:hypothetical protein